MLGHKTLFSVILGEEDGVHSFQAEVGIHPHEGQERDPNSEEERSNSSRT